MCVDRYYEQSSQFVICQLTVDANNYQVETRLQVTLVSRAEKRSV